MNYKLVKIINANDCIYLEVSDTKDEILHVELRIKYNIMKNILYIEYPYTNSKENTFCKILNDIGLTSLDITFYKNEYNETLYIATINYNTLKNLITLCKLKGIEMKGF